MKDASPKRNLAIQTIILMIIFLAIPATTPATIIYVDDDNTSGPWDGTIDHPYQHIQDGIDNANPHDTIHVYNGNYEENVTVDKKLDLTGEDKDNTIIDGGGSGDVVTVTNDSASISGFSIQNSGTIDTDAGVRLSSSHNDVFENILTGNRHGIWLEGSSEENAITSNDIRSNLKGMTLDHSPGNTISGNTITYNQAEGIYVYRAPDNSIFRNNISYNDLSGIVLSGCSGFNVYGDTITNNANGILISASSQSTISGNLVADNQYRGIHIGDPAIYPCYHRHLAISGNTLANNSISLKYTCTDTVTNNTFTSHGIRIEGFEHDHWDSHIIFGNSINGQPIVFYKNANGQTISGDVAQVILASCTNCTIEDLEISNVDRPIQLAYSSSNIIKGNTLRDNINSALSLHASSDNTIYHNNLDNLINASGGGPNNWFTSPLNQGNFWNYYEGSDADGDGIGDSPYDIPLVGQQDEYPLMYPWNKTVFVDDDADPGWYDPTHVATIQEGIDAAAEGGGVYVYNGTYSENSVVGTRIHLVGQHRDNLFVDGGGGGDVILLSSDKIRFRGFTVRNSGSGAGLKVHSSFSTISGNTFTDNATGVWIEGSSDSNEVFHNNFINNTQGAYDECENFWDDDFPSGGNYWSDFDEPGEGAYDDNGDGIVDSPYGVPGGINQDGYPFVQPWDGTEAPVFCGDAGANGVIDIGDMVYLINYLYKGDPPPIPAACVGDVNKDQRVDVGDLVYLKGYLYVNGPPPSEDCCGGP